MNLTSRLSLYAIGIVYSVIVSILWLVFMVRSMVGQSQPSPPHDDCAGRVCGGSCGTCKPGQICTTDGQCTAPTFACTPVAIDKTSPWSVTGSATAKSCSSPNLEYVGQMCQGDPTSIVIDTTRSKTGEDGKGCFVSRAETCPFYMNKVASIEFEITLQNCKQVWLSFWANPTTWDLPADTAGELDMIETCGGVGVQNNFAGCSNQPKKCQQVTLNTDQDNYSATIKLVNDNGNVTMYENGVYTKAFYNDLYSSTACSGGADCSYTLIADVWNGTKGDPGYASCMYKGTQGKPLPTSCKFWVRNIRITPSVPGDNIFKGTDPRCKMLLAQ